MTSYTRPPYTRPPKCYLCSHKQFSPDKPVAVYHRHRSARQVRSLQGAEYANYNCTYMCPTCQVTHVAQLPYGLDVCVSTSQLHEFNQPREVGVVCPPDTSHVDWLTIPGAKIEDLILAWRLDYSKYTRPMRILLVAGLNDLAKGGSFDTLTSQYKRLYEVVKIQGREYHPGMANSFAVAPLLVCLVSRQWANTPRLHQQEGRGRADQRVDQGVQQHQRDLPGAWVPHLGHQDY